MCAGHTSPGQLLFPVQLERIYLWAPIRAMLKTYRQAVQWVDNGMIGRQSYGMTSTIPMDAAGRVVVPKAIRERYGLVGRSHEMEITDTPEGIVLRPKGDMVPAIRDTSGWVVFQSGEEETVDPVAAVDAERCRRERSVAGAL